MSEQGYIPKHEKGSYEPKHAKSGATGGDLKNGGQAEPGSGESSVDYARLMREAEQSARPDTEPFSSSHRADLADLAANLPPPQHLDDPWQPHGPEHPVEHTHPLRNADVARQQLEQAYERGAPSEGSAVGAPAETQRRADDHSELAKLVRPAAQEVDTPDWRQRTRAKARAKDNEDLVSNLARVTSLREGVAEMLKRMPQDGAERPQASGVDVYRAFVERSEERFGDSPRVKDLLKQTSAYADRIATDPDAQVNQAGPEVLGGVYMALDKTAMYFSSLDRASEHHGPREIYQADYRDPSQRERAVAAAVEHELREIFQPEYDPRRDTTSTPGPNGLISDVTSMDTKLGVQLYLQNILPESESREAPNYASGIRRIVLWDQRIDSDEARATLNRYLADQERAAERYRKTQ
jgi:hypothetical protein